MTCPNLPAISAGAVVLFLTTLLLAFHSSAGMSASLAEAVEAELQAHVRKMELRAAEMHDLHIRSMYKLRRKREEAHVRERRSNAHLSSHKHGFIPGTGIGNRETLGIQDVRFLPSPSLVDAPVAFWEGFAVGRKQFLVASMPEIPRVEIFEFVGPGRGPPRDPLQSVYQQNLQVRAMTSFTQTFYNSGSTSQETKVVLVEDDNTVLLVVKENGTLFEAHNMTRHPSHVTDVKFFTIGLDSYLVFAQDDDLSGPGDGTKTSIYLWSENSQIFDLRQEIRTYGAVAVEAFEIHGVHYIVTAEKYNTSTVWRYNTRQSQFRVYQHLEPRGVTNSLYLTLGYEHYIVFIRAHIGKSVFYLWDGLHFQRAQVIPTPAASSWSIIRGALTCQDIGLVTLSSLRPWPGSITVFNVSDSHEFVGESLPAGSLPREEIRGVHSVLPFSTWFDKSFAVMVVDLAVKGQVEVTSLLFEIVQQITQRESPYAIWADKAFQKAFTVVENNLNEYEQKIVDLTADLEDAVTLTDGDITIGGNLLFNGTITFNGTLEVVRVQADDVISNTTIGGDRARAILNEFERNVTRNTDAIEDLEAQFDDRVTLDGNETVTGHKTFKRLMVDQMLTSNEISAATINDVDIEALDDEAIRSNIDGQTVTGIVYIDHGLTVDGDVHLDDGALVNGFDMANAVTESGTQTITGIKTFSQDVAVEANAILQENMAVNSIDISEEVVTLSGDHHLEERITFGDELHIDGDIVTTSTVDTIDVSELGPDVVRVNQDFLINGSVTFTETVTADADVSTNLNVNNMDLADWNEWAVRINVDTTISGNKTFEGDLFVAGDLDYNGIIDGFDLFLDSLLVNSTNSTFLTPIIPGLLFPYGRSENDSALPPFDDVYAEQLQLEEFFPFFGRRHSSLFVNINGIISFVNPVDQYTPSPFPIGNNKFYITPFWSDVDTRIGGTIYYRQMVRASRDDEPLFREADRIVCTSFREHFVSTWLLIATWHEVAYFGATGSARNTFQAVLVTDGDISFAIFNFDNIEWTTGTASSGNAATGLGGFPALVGFNAGDNLNFYEVEFSRTNAVVDIDNKSNVGMPGRWVFKTDGGFIEGLSFQGQTITGEKTFSSCLTVAGSMWVNGTVDGIDLADAVTLTGAHTVTGQKTFLEGIEVEGHIFPTGTVDGVDLSTFVPTVMTRTTTQTIQGTVIFNDAMEAKKNVNVAGDINGVDIVELAEDAVYKNDAEEQVVSATKTFAEAVNVTTGHLDFDGLVNGYNMTTDFMDLSSDQTVTVAKTFKDGFNASSNMTVDGTVDGVNIHTLWTEAALTTRDETLTGIKTFTENMTVNGDLTLGRNLNSLDLSEDVMMVNQAQTVNGIKKFGEVLVTGDVSAGSASVTNLNGQDWTAFVNGRVTLTTDQDITGGVTFSEELTVEGDIVTDNEVNGIDLPAFADSILYTTGDQEVTGSNQLSGTGVFNKPVTLATTLDTVDIDVMKARAIYLDNGTQTITAKKTFKHDMVIDNDLSVTDLLNYVELSDLNDDIVWTNQGPQNISGKKVFLKGFTTQRNIDVVGTVNGIDISEEVLTLNRDQDITGDYTFEDEVTIDQDLSVSGLINDVNITEVDNGAVKEDENQVVSSPIVFNSTVVVEGSITVADGDTVDTVDLSELHDMAKFKDVAFTLPNGINFSQPLNLSGPLTVDGTVHGIDFQAWAGTVLTKDTTQTITGNYGISGTLQGDVDVTVPMSIVAETAYGINIDEFVGDLVKLEGNQNITGSKTFNDRVTVEGDVEVAGTVDGIDISEEIVTLDGDETITGFKTFNACDVHTASHILTTGEVNGYEISREHADTLDFRQPKKITGHKAFANSVDVVGDLLVGGLVDGKDLARGFTLDTPQRITAFHMFNARATVTGNIAVGGYVQGKNLTYIDLTRITLSGNHTLEGALTFTDDAVFSDDVETEYLFDGVDLSALSALEETRYEGYEDDIYELACYAETQCERSEALAEVVNNFIDAIDYVEEIQVLEQHIRHFETFSIDGISYLAAAVHADEHGDVCTASIIYRWEADAGIISEFERIKTNAAVLLKHFRIGEDDYLVVANSGHTACHETPSDNAIYKFGGYNFTEVGSIGEEFAATSDLDAFTIDDMHFLVLTTYDGAIATVYKYNELSGEFEVFQDMPTGVTSSVETVVLPKGTFLVFTLYLEELSVVYCFNPDSQTFEHFEDLESEHAREIESFHFDNVYGFALADHMSVSDVDATFEVQVRVFIWNDETGMFDEMYTVPVVNPSDVDVFSEGNFLYMSVVQEYHSVDLFRYEGSAGFVKSYHMPFHGARSVAFFNLQDAEYAATDKFEYDQLFMVVAVDPFTPQDVFSHLLKVVNLGGSVPMRKWENMCESTLRDPTRISTQPPTC